MYEYMILFTNDKHFGFSNSSSFLSKQFKFHFFTSDRINRDVSKLSQLFLPFFRVRVDEHSFESLYE